MAYKSLLMLLQRRWLEACQGNILIPVITLYGLNRSAYPFKSIHSWREIIRAHF